MPHAFDTGLTTPQRSQIGAALVARLGALKKTGPAAGLYVTTVERIPSPLNGDDEADYIKHVAGGQLPAVLVALGRKRYEPAGMSDPRDQYLANLHVHVYVVSDNLRAPPTGAPPPRMAGDAVSAASNQKDPGIETMLEHTEELLLGYQVSDASQMTYQLVPIEERELFHTDEITVWEQEYQLAVQRDLKRNKGLTETLQTVDTKSNLNDGGAANPIAQPLTTIPI